ncbi:MAG: hypothetical protein ACI9XR_002030 [Flavobacterium sp.]|jgi:hypothetical protein
MKKNIVLIVLFVLPLVAYLFFASGVNSFAKLPTLTKNVAELNSLTTFENKEVKLKDKISIISFTGTDVWQKRGNFFNLYEKIYKKNEEFKDFQIVVIVPKGKESEVDRLTTDLKKLGTISGWNFVFLDSNQIKEFYASLKLQNQLDATFGSNEVYIIDKQLNLRGRKGKSVKGDVEYREGYNTQMVSELHNEMTDDVKIILAEYRLALKRNNNASRKI